MLSRILKNVKVFVLCVVPLCALVGCGTLQVGIESTPTPGQAAKSTATPTNSVVITATRPSVSPTPTETTPLATVTAAPERITFPVGGTSFTFETKLVEGVPQRYVLHILAQQKMSITSSSNVTMTVLDAQDNPLPASASSPGQWQATVPQTGDYVVELLGQGLVAVTINIPPSGS
jgi:hypothetical protein